MTSIYKIKNENNRNSIPYNELLLLKTIKSLENRNKELSDKYILLWENLEGKPFDRSRELEYI